MEYQPPPQQPFPGAPPPPGSQAGSSVKLPAIFLIIAFALGLLYALYTVISAATGLDNEMSIGLLRQIADSMQNPELADALRQAADQAEAQGGNRGVMRFFLPVVWIFTNAFGIYASIQMLNLKGYGMAMAAAIISIIPCLGPCCCGCAPVGIWALVVLGQQDVKQAFRS